MSTISKYMPLLYPLGIILAGVLGYAVRYFHSKMEAQAAAPAEVVTSVATPAVSEETEQQTQAA